MRDLRVYFSTLLVGILAVAAQASNADQPMPMIHALCMPDPGIEHFAVDIENFNELSDYIWNGSGSKTAAPTKEEREALLKEKYGLIKPWGSAYSYTCKIGKSNYTISGIRPPVREKGMCGGDPRTNLSLKENDKLVVDKVYFEPTCLNNKGAAYAESFTVERFGVSGIVVTNGREKSLLAFGDFHEPLTQKNLDCLSKEGYFDAATRARSVKKCLAETKP